MSKAYWKGKHLYPETKEKMRLAHLGKCFAEKNGRWKGDKVKTRALHTWVRTYLPQPEFCQICNKKPPEDLANITGIQNRDFKNWKYLCTKCHMKLDFGGRKLSQEHRQKISITVTRTLRMKKNE